MKNVTKILLLAAIFVFGFFGPAHAAAPFTDNFDSYSSGNLSGQGSWSGNPGPQVEPTFHVSAPNGASLPPGETVYKGGTFTATGTWYFKGYSPASGALQVAFGTNGSVNLQWSGLNAGWHDLGLDWTPTQYRYYTDGNWSDWTSYNDSGGGVTYIQLWGITSTWYVDDFTDAAPAGLDTITITYPNSTPSYFDHITVAYHVDSSRAGFGRADMMLCGGDVVACETLCTNGYNAQYDANCWKIINTSGCAASSTSEIYDRTLHFSSMMVSLQGATSTVVAAKAYLFVASPNASPHCAFTGSIYDLENNPQWVATSNQLLVQYNRQGLETAGQMEDCTQYTGIDNVVCNLKNFLLGAVLPSNTAINQFQNTISLFSQKFPIAYITEILTTIGNIWSGINENAPITLTIFGNTGTLDDSIFGLTIPNTSLTLGGAIKALFAMLAVMVFCGWAIGYMHRITQVA